jgi:hypothetical protein
MAYLMSAGLAEGVMEVLWSNAGHSSTLQLNTWPVDKTHF